MIEVLFILNGEERRVRVRPGEALLDTLRERCGITSVKNGCKPQGQCGCCLALIDGKAKVTCATPTERVAGKEVLTLEGVPDEERALIARAFVAAAGLQCGFCTPGLALRAKHLLDRNPDPSRAEIAKAIDGNLCRCTGYSRVIDAIRYLARARRGEPIPEPVADGGVGASLARVGGQAMTLGDRPYIEDMSVPGMLFGAVVLSAHPRAKVLRIDTSRAEALPGVHSVLTASDVPGERWYGIFYADWPGLVAEGEEVRCVG
ncbi:MAG: 2Fe-2S iron-sulfur cluster binding domain-containing protein, partial [Deltaproteobacteria bacterium]|nr:2Fe-2S iron-sulfur cluster binding domain-containing protein [Deltaproteobacteria bacterium]